jgi:hypothetical protein
MQLHELDNNPKTHNSTVAQILKDIVGLRIPQLKDDVQTLLSHMKPEDIAAADDVYRHHRYPSRAITFHRLSSYDSYNLSGLTPAAQAVLFLFCRCISQDNCVAIPVPVICQEIGVVDKTARQSIQLLRMAGIIALTRPAARHMPATYVVDPALICAGKAPSESDIKAFTNARDADELYISPDTSKKTRVPMIIQCARHMQNIVRMQHGQRNISIGQLTDYVAPAFRDKKKPVAGANSNEQDSEL